MGAVTWKKVAAMNQHYRNWSLPRFLEIQQELGMESLELWLGPPHFYMDRLKYEDCKPIRRLVNAHQMEIVSVTSSSFAWQYQYAVPNREVFQAAKTYFKNGIRVAAELGASIMTVNSGWGSCQEKEAEGFARSAEMLGELADFAKEYQVTLALESLTSLESRIGDTLGKTKRLWETVHHPNLEIMVDTVAMGYQKETLDDWFRAFGTHLVHMHFIDMVPSGDSDDHLVWGDGGFSLEQMVRTLENWNYQGYLVQEIAADRYREDPMEADRRGRNVLYEIINQRYGEKEKL